MGAATATELYRRARRETGRGRRSAAYKLLLAALMLNPEPVLCARILISLSYHEADHRRLDDGLALLDRADSLPDIPDPLRALTLSQRGLLYQRAGRLTEAAVWYERAAGMFTDAEPEDMSRNLLNSGFLNMQRGLNRAARSDFSRCAEIARRHGLDVLAVKASHNLGYLQMLAGDLPAALRTMDSVAPVLMTQSPIHAGIYYTDRARVLSGAGLFREADDDLSRAADLFVTAKATHDLATAELGRAQLALLDERWDDAATFACRARRRFAGRGTHSWAMLAQQVAIAARVGAGRYAGTSGKAIRLADRLQANGLQDDARRARLTAALATLAASGRGRVDAARNAAGSATDLHAGDPIATRLLARTVRAAVMEAQGRAADADRERRGGMADLHRYQASFGSLDLQTAIGRHARRLARDGLARAIGSGRAATVFAWAERARALSARLPPVMPPADDDASALLEELRQARQQMQAQILEGRADTRLKQHCIRLEQHVRQRSWYAPGPMTTVAPAPLSRLRDRLRQTSASFVAHIMSDDRVYALAVNARRQTLVDLGPAAAILETQRRLRRDLDLLAFDNLPKAVRDTVRAAKRTALLRIDDALWRPLHGLMTDGPLLLAPSVQLTAVPWPLMPSLNGRPVAVVPSVTAWLAAQARPSLPADPAVAFAIGPNLLRANDEIRMVADAWSREAAQAVATTAEFRDATEKADILHIAAHGTHEPDNPLFSHLQLDDGPLFGYEFQRLSRLPNHVMLSACELGLADARPTDETLGMTVAILHSGARSVVSAVALVSDTVACRVAQAHHAGLRRGQPPAAALADAINDFDDDEDPPPMVCFGAGW